MTAIHTVKSTKKTVVVCQSKNERYWKRKDQTKELNAKKRKTNMSIILFFSSIICNLSTHTYIYKTKQNKTKKQNE
jgi:hypothetical protein